MTNSSYGSYGGLPPQAEPARPVSGGGMATAALVLGILALLTSFTVVGGVVLGLLAVIFGIVGLRRARRGLAFGRGRAIAGILLGLLSIVVAGVLVAAGLSLWKSPEGKNLQSCLKKAGTSQSEIQKCKDQFKSKVGS